MRTKTQLKHVKKRTQKPKHTRTGSPEVDEFEVTRQKIAVMERSAVVFIDELRKLPLWQQRAIVGEVFEIANHSLRYMRIIVAGVQCERATRGLRNPREKAASRIDFARKFVEVWSLRTSPNGQNG